MPPRYQYMVTVQQLAELEEILRFKEKEQELKRLHPSGVARDLNAKNKRRLQAKWRKRLHYWVPRDVTVWHQLLQVRSIVLPPVEDEDNWIQLAGLCRRSKRLTLCKNILARLNATTGTIGQDQPTRVRVESDDGETRFESPKGYPKGLKSSRTNKSPTAMGSIINGGILSRTESAWGR